MSWRALATDRQGTFSMPLKQPKVWRAYLTFAGKHTPLRKRLGVGRLGEVCNAAVIKVLQLLQGTTAVALALIIYPQDEQET